jgi:protein-S-isoprenylcysteine O-methyltransferase Ste14
MRLKQEVKGMSVVGLRDKAMKAPKQKLRALAGWIYSLLYELIVIGGLPYAAYKLEQLMDLGILPSALILKVPGLFLAIGGIAVSGACMITFILRGHGTPACFDPPQQLVAKGIYRYSRNPMILGNVATVLGLGLIFHSTAILLYGIVLMLGFHFYFLLVEEPRLEQRFGDSYRQYARRVGRWVPMIKVRDANKRRTM